MALMPDGLSDADSRDLLAGGAPSDEAEEAALPLYRQVGAVLGEANCILGLGDVAAAKGETGAARARWREALALYARIPEPWSIGFAHHRLRRRAETPEQAAEHREAARRAWASIDRPDLIEKYLDESA